jgi:hypothetical protein
MRVISKSRQTATASWLSALLLSACLSLSFMSAQACSSEEQSAMNEPIRQQAGAKSEAGGSGTRVADSTASASSSASASASSRASSGTKSGDCKAESSASAEARSDGKHEYDYDSDRQASQKGDCQASAKSSATAVTGDPESGKKHDSSGSEDGSRKP